MFRGAINANCRRFFAANANYFAGKTLVVGCSGNFTLEQTVTRSSQPKAIFSNDVSLYSSSLGYWVTDTDWRLDVVEPKYAWFEKYMGNNLHRAALMVLLVDFLTFEPCKNEYQRSMHDHMLANWDHYYQQSLANMEQITPHIRVNRFFCEDVATFYERFPNDDEHVFTSFMPYMKGDYEKQFKRISEIFSWDEPTYPLIDRERQTKMYELLQQRNYIIYDDREGLDMPLAWMERKAGSINSKDVFVYSNLPISRLFKSGHRNFQPQNIALIGPDDEIGDKTQFRFLVVENKVINYYRELYMAKNIQYTDGALPLLVFADEKLIGCIIFALVKYGGSGEFYLLTDFPIPHSKYARLSKLIVMLALSKPVKQIIEEKWWQRARTIVTTVRTKKNHSMKYRGAMKLKKRNKADGFLNYQAEAGKYTIKQVKQEWTQKLARHLRN